MCNLLLSLGELLGCEGITLRDMEIAKMAYLKKMSTQRAERSWEKDRIRDLKSHNRVNLRRKGKP